MKEGHEGFPPDNLSEDQERNLRIRETEEKFVASGKMKRIDARASDEWPLSPEAVAELPGPVEGALSQGAHENVIELSPAAAAKASKAPKSERPETKVIPLEKTKELGWVVDRLDDRSLRFLAAKVEIAIHIKNSVVDIALTPRRMIPGAANLLLGMLEKIAHDTGRTSTQAKKLPDGRVALKGIFTVGKDYEDDLKRLKADGVTTIHE